jgi:hypothetical protein
MISIGATVRRLATSPWPIQVGSPKYKQKIGGTEIYIN